MFRSREQEEKRNKLFLCSEKGFRASGNLQAGQGWLQLEKHLREHSDMYPW